MRRMSLLLMMVLVFFCVGFASQQSLSLTRSGQDYLAISEGNQVNLDVNNLTIEMHLNPFVQPESFSDDELRFISKFGTGATNERSYMLSYKESSGNHFFLLALWDASNTGYYISSANYDLSTSSFTHLAVTFDASNGDVKFLINGVQLGSTHSTACRDIKNSNEMFYLGNGAGLYHNYEGLMDEVRIWNIVRTTEQIVDNYQKELVGPIAGLVGYWKLNGDGTDYSGNGNHLTAYGNPVYSDDVPDCFQVPDLETGKVASYDFNGNADDGSGNGNHGTVNGATLTTGRNGNANSAYYFDGVNDYIQLPNNAVEDLVEGSVSMWMNIEQTSTHQVPFCINGVDTPDWKAFIIHQPSDGMAYFRAYHAQANASASASASASDVPLYDTEWHHVVGTWNNLEVALWIDGQKVATGVPIQNGTSVANVWLGNSVVNRSYWTKGKMDEIKIYNRVLFPNDIQVLYTGETVDTTNNQTPNTIKIDKRFLFATGRDPYVGFLCKDLNNGFWFMNIQNYDTQDSIITFNIGGPNDSVWNYTVVDFNRDEIDDFSISFKNDSSGVSVDTIYNIDGVPIGNSEF